MRTFPVQLIISLMVAVFVVACVAPQVPLPKGTLNAAEVQQLFSDHTVTSVTVAKKRESVTYYDPNGEARQIRAGELRNGTWRVSKNGRICLQFGSNEQCRIIVWEDAKYKKYVVKDDGQHRYVVDYKSFQDGNPRGL